MEYRKLYFRETTPKEMVKTNQIQPLAQYGGALWLRTERDGSELGFRRPIEFDPVFRKSRVSRDYGWRHSVIQNFMSLQASSQNNLPDAPSSARKADPRIANHVPRKLDVVLVEEAFEIDLGRSFDDHLLVQAPGGREDAGPITIRPGVLGIIR